MMNEKIDAEKNIDDFMLPGFRFHPTDEELVGFYLKRKLQQRSLPIELIKQVDIYKYDPWDLPKLASTGEKEWYFYCPRDRKYRNSTRPNRVTGSGFWKATGTDRPIYSSDGTKCIGLKKSLVFYRGRAAKGFKTDWMMHEFRLPSVTDVGAAPPQKMSDKNLPATDSWAICRIFKKTSSMANRLLNHANSHQYSWNNVSLSDYQATTSSPDHAAFTYSPYHRSTISSDNLSALNNIPSSYKIFTTTTTTTCSNADHLAFSPNSAQVPAAKNNTTTATDHFSSLLFNNQSPVCLDFEGSQHYFNGLSSSSSLTQLMMQENVSAAEDEQEGLRKSTSTTNIRTNPFNNKSSMGFPFSLQPSSSDLWKPPPNPITNLPWDNSCPTEMSSNTAYSTTNKSCYTS